MPTIKACRRLATLPRHRIACEMLAAAGTGTVHDEMKLMQLNTTVDVRMMHTVDMPTSTSLDGSKLISWYILYNINITTDDYVFVSSIY